MSLSSLSEQPQPDPGSSGPASAWITCLPTGMDLEQSMDHLPDNRNPGAALEDETGHQAARGNPVDDEAAAVLESVAGQAVPAAELAEPRSVTEPVVPAEQPVPAAGLAERSEQPVPAAGIGEQSEEEGPIAGDEFIADWIATGAHLGEPAGSASGAAPGAAYGAIVPMPEAASGAASGATVPYVTCEAQTSLQRGDVLAREMDSSAPICSKCNYPISEIFRSKFVGKKRGEHKFICRTCNNCVSMLYRKLNLNVLSGAGLALDDLGAEAEMFFRTAAEQCTIGGELKWALLKEHLCQTLSKKKVNKESIVLSTKELPLSVWEKKGFDIERIRACGQRKDHPVFGEVWAVPLKTTNFEHVFLLLVSSA